MRGVKAPMRNYVRAKSQGSDSFTFSAQASMRLIQGILAGGVLLLGVACHHRKPTVVSTPVPVPVYTPPTPPPPPADSMEAVGSSARVYYDDETGFTDSLRLTIRDEETFRGVWAQATQRQATSPALPEINFQSQMLLLVSAGRMRAGDQIHVDSIGRTQGRLVAVVRTTVECQQFPAVTHPMEIVRVARSESEIHFVERRGKTGDC
jgi:hypothetical protein